MANGKNGKKKNGNGKNGNGKKNGNGAVQAVPARMVPLLGRNGRGRRRRGNGGGLVGRNGIVTRGLKATTATGLQWALANLHPCNERQTLAVGYPDSIGQPTHCTRMQRTVTIAPPGVGCTGNNVPSIDTCSWNLMVITTPWPEYPVLVCAAQGNDEPPSFFDFLKKGGSFEDWDTIEEKKWNQWYYTMYPNFTKYTSANENSYYQSSDIANKYQKIRVVAKGTTTYLNASRLYDGGRVICGQYPCASRYLDTFDPEKWVVKFTDLTALVHTHALLRHRHQIPPTAHPHRHTVQDHCHFMSDQTKGNTVNTIYHRHTITDPEKTDTDTAGTEGQTSGSFTGRRTMGSSRFFNGELDEYNGSIKRQYCGTSSDPNLGSVITGFNYASGAAPINENTGVPNDYAVEQVSGPDYSKRTASDDIGDYHVASFNSHLGKCADESTLFKYGQYIGPNIPIETCTVDPADGTAKKVYKDYKLGSENHLDYYQCGSSDIENPKAPWAFGPCVDAPSWVQNAQESVVGRISLLDGDEPDQPNWYFSAPPTTEDRLFYGDSKATTWEARRGTYQPLRINEFDMQQCHTGAATFYELYNEHLPTKTDVTPSDFKKTFDLAIGGGGMWGIAYYRNINKATSVTVKTVQYTQGIVNPNGPYANLTPMDIPPDPVAIDSASLENKRLAHAYPSSFNDLGKILGDIFGTVKQVGSVVKGVAGSLSNVPILGDIAGAISGVLSGLGL